MTNQLPAHAQQAFEELQSMGCPVILNDWGGHFQIDAEAANDEEWANYYGGGYEGFDDFGVNNRINEVLDKHGMFAEWVNPGVLSVSDI